MIGVALAVVAALAFTVEATLGFGATVVALAVGALFVPVHDLLPAFVPINMVLSASIVVRDRKSVDVRMLLTRAVPFMALGLPAGLYAAHVVDGHVFTRAFGVVVIALAVRELFGGKSKSAPLGAVARGIALVAAGAVHGAFGTGGPLAVYALGRSLDDKRAFRATLAALWLTLNVALIASFVAEGRLNADSGARSAWLAIGLVVGLVAGELLHARVDAARFRVLVWVGLALAGVGLVLR